MRASRCGVRGVEVCGSMSMDNVGWMEFGDAASDIGEQLVPPQQISMSRKDKKTKGG